MLSDLEVLFSSAARVEILRLFLLNPENQYYQREIERETGQPIRAVQREVKRLAEIGLLVHSTEGNRIFYRVNPDYSLLAELMALFQRATGAVRSAKAMRVEKALPQEPGAARQPFDWLETPAVPPLPPSLRHMQVDGEWDRAY